MKKQKAKLLHILHGLYWTVFTTTMVPGSKEHILITEIREYHFLGITYYRKVTYLGCSCGRNFYSKSLIK